jgi:SAM-dependent MidA family methyltransferase
MKMSKNLEDYIKEKIKIGGPINIESFMSISLNDKKQGYYIKSTPIGKDNDFITAPEVSQMFGELIAVWLLDTWNKIGKPKINIIELGPGNGFLMQDIIRVAKNFPIFLTNISLWVYEINEELSKKQEKNIEHNFKRIDSLEKLPNGINFIIANEFFDAIPIRQYIFDTESWYERLVT